ncbi:MAG: hypothetical protein FJY95_08200 [Candidatus Handelsmanbacteria bacterium]|nr:hypothetical protein [Candidatus Handelsmanbacteria bacterium]
MKKWLLWAFLLCASAAMAQSRGPRAGATEGTAILTLQGPGVLFNALDPAVRRWYVPQELYREYQWRQWEYTNYARNLFQRYVDINLQGDYFYDLYGRFVTRGWLIYDHTQTQPQNQFGNSLFKDSRFSSWFNSLVISSDARGQYYYALSISNRLRTTLTPMTFSKPQFDGLQWDLASDKYAATILYSRVNAPGGSAADPPIRFTNNTSLFGGRATVQVGDFVTLGATMVNSHQSHTQLSSFESSLIKGELTVDQNERPVSWVEVILRDDSPEDGVGGASYFQGGSDLTVTYLDGFSESAREIGFEPVIEGGFQRAGFLAADGREPIRIRYDLDSPDFVSNAHGDKSEITALRFRLAVGNDYQVWANSDRQTSRGTGGVGSAGEQSVPLLVARAPGNVRDNSNLRILSFDYGLPTANQIYGGTVEVRNVLGCNFYGEYDLSYRYRMYPNPNLVTHDGVSGVVGKRAAPAWMMNLTKQDYPFFAMGEAFSMDNNYSTTSLVAQDTPRPGFVDYGDTRRLFEFVDDNDDQDRFPDNQRIDWLTGDNEVFPGWDENNDFISDFNQNDNRRSRRRNEIPDYEEPFLRYNVDRPEYLFGIDANNNGWVDRFENDEDPDYPYRRDHQGYNAYTGFYLTPEVRLLAGRIDERLLSEDRRNRTNYFMATVERDYPGLGRLRFFDLAKRTKDQIPENLFQWVYLTAESEGELRRVADPLLFANAWSNSFWLGFDYTGIRELKFSHQLKFDLTHVLLDRQERQLRGFKSDEHFFGLINKAGYRLAIGRIQLEPRWKSEYRHQSRDLVSARQREEVNELLSLIGRFPLLNHTFIEGGTELLWFKDLKDERNDFVSRVLALQFSNSVAYQGYNLITQLGLKLDHRNPRGQQGTTTSESFITVFAGLGE